MKQLNTRIRKVVSKIDETATLVLLMDAASQHISKDVLMHARRLNVILIMIPGKLTWLLQPLDVSVFRVLKDVYKQSLLRQRMCHEQGIVTMEGRHAALNATIHEVLVQKDWSNAFDKVGALGDFSNLRKSIQFYFPNGVTVPAHPLTDEELEELAGRHRLSLGVNFNSAPQRLLDYSQSQQLASQEESRLPNSVHASALDANEPHPRQQRVVPKSLPRRVLL